MKTPVLVRQMLMRDSADVLEIDAESRIPWSETDLSLVLRRRDANGIVATTEGMADAYGSIPVDAVLGFAVYTFSATSIDLMKCAVYPPYHRHGIGSQVVAKLIDKLSAGRRATIHADVPESNLAAQLFFRSCGFRALKILPAFYQWPDLGHGGEPETAYRMVYDLAARDLALKCLDALTDRKLSDWSA